MDIDLLNMSLYFHDIVILLILDCHACICVVALLYTMLMCYLKSICNKFKYKFDNKIEVMNLHLGANADSNISMFHLIHVIFK